MPADEALLLIGHGSARYADAGAALHHHAGVLRQLGAFAQVEVGLLNGAPGVAEALSRVAGRAARIVPFFMEDGYFSRVAVPRAVEAVWKGADPSDRPRVSMGPPIGIHPAMAGIIDRQARLTCCRLALAMDQAAVLVVGHGSATAPGRALALHRHASALAAKSPFAQVRTACLEEPPFVADVLASLRAHATVVVGFFANLGGHVRDDLPGLISAEGAARGSCRPDVVYDGSVAFSDSMVGIIIDQAMAANPRPGATMQANGCDPGGPAIPQ